MEESAILKAAWICAILGMAGLSAYYFLAPDTNNAAMPLFEGGPVIVEGVIKSMSYSKDNKTSFLTLKQNDLFMVAFESLNISKGDAVVARGVFNTYQGKKELIVERVIKR